MRFFSLFALLIPTALFGITSADAAGEPCDSNSDCRSGDVCYPGPGYQAGMYYSKYCLRRSLNCAWPGEVGAKYGTKYNVEGQTFECMNPGGGKKAQFVALGLGSVANGLPCDNSSQCKSRYCSSKLPSKGVLGFDVCMDPEMNCPIPGGPGIKFDGEYNFSDSHWICSRDVGLQHDGAARAPDFYQGGNCSGFWEKIDCRGVWFPIVADFALQFCRSGGCAATDIGSCQAFCRGVEFAYDEYLKQTRD